MAAKLKLVVKNSAPVAQRASSTARARKSAAATPRFVDDYLSYLLGRASQAVYREFSHEVESAGLSSLEWRVLATLPNDDGYTIGKLAREVLAQQPTLTKLVNRMETSGLLERRSDALDRRKTRVWKTEQGKTLVSGLLAAAKQHETQVLAEFDASDITALKRMLRAMIDRFDSSTPKEDV